ncbi:hypothetical protein WEI85_26265 [Actinomycetes bacterium KLBMP 9797]
MTMSQALTRRGLLGGGAALAATTLLPEAPAASATEFSGRVRLRLPAPSGRYPVGTTTLHLVDRSRHDPYLTAQPYRELMVNLTYPARDIAGRPVARWLTPGWAASVDEVMQNMVPGHPPNVVDWAGTRAHAYVDAPARMTRGGWPVLLLTVGHWASHCTHRLVIEDLASHGYVVATFDPTYETPVVFPGGRLVPVHDAAAPPPGAEITDPLFLAYLRNIYSGRFDDAQFVLDELHAIAAGHRSVPDGLPSALDLTRIGALGGGTGAALTGLQLAHEDQRVRAVFAGDDMVSWPTAAGPAPILPVVSRGLDRPVLVIRPGTTDVDPLWDGMWRRMRGWHRQIELPGAGAIWFTDYQAVLPQVQRGLDMPADAYAHWLGSIDPAAALAASRTHLPRFFTMD